MFTGLIAELGRITAIEKGESSAVFTVSAPALISQIALGDSVAVNGVCLTATSIADDGFTADVMVQTLAVTSLSQLAVGSPVNLELAALLNTRMGGHIVQGHVDGVATVVGLTPGEKWAQFDITVPEKLARYIVNQGSICLDGVSLIPETLERTNLASKQAGDLINVEVDVLAKYVERLLAKRDK
jgi:riboflavin synthase